MSNPPIYSASRIADDGVIFVSGQVPVDNRGQFVGDDFGAQANAVIDRIGDVLAANGQSLGAVVKLTYFLTDLADLTLLREVVAARLPDPKPASSLVQVAGLIDSRYRIEVEAIATAPRG